MEIANKVYEKFEITIAKVPEFNQEIRLDGSVIYVKAFYPDGGSVWVRADRLRTDKKAQENLFEQAMWALANYQSKLGLTKAETKRRLMSSGIISK